ncbi:MAG: hypothetical protein E7523_02370 [Ruminococcaceae bacterium]|nr:hypothetical protein [Oscillospiraceae bacterium]
MEILDLATKALGGIIHLSTKRLAAKEKADPLPEVAPSIMKNEDDNTFICGFSSAEVMPADVDTKKYYIAGYRINHPVTGVKDPTTVSAMWLGCKEGEGILLLCADVIGLTGYDVNEVRASLADFCAEKGCKNISISCSHTHASIDTVGYWGPLPLSGKDKSYQKQLFAALKKVAIEAWQNRTVGNLYMGDISVPEAIEDHREPIFCSDKLTRLRFVPADGSAETWFMNYSAHPNTMGGDNTLISADYPCYMRRRINETKKVNVLFAVGAIAAVDIAPSVAEDRTERTMRGGQILGDAAWKIDNDELLNSEITVLRQPYYAPVDNCLLALMPTIGAVSSVKAPCPQGELGMALITEMTYLKIGSRQILMIPGEAFPENIYGGYADAEHSATGLPADINSKPLAEIADDANLVVFGVTNDMTGYMVAKNDFVLHPTQAYLNTWHDRFDRHHYHETNSLGYLTTDTMEKVFSGMMKRVRDAQK